MGSKKEKAKNESSERECVSEKERGGGGVRKTENERFRGE